LISSGSSNLSGRCSIGGSLLDLDGLLGLRGRQRVFVATGIPAVVLPVVVFFILPDRPERARWLPAEGRDWLHDVLETERAGAQMVEHQNPFRALLERRVLLLALLYVAFPLAAYGLSYWLPTVVKGVGVSNTTSGFLNIIPWVVVAFALWWVPRSAARMNDQTWHIVIPALVGAACLLLSVLVPGNALKFAFLCIAAAGIFAGQPVFWSLPPSFLKAATAAAGIAAINSVGNLAGFIAQNVVPWIKDSTGSDLTPMFFLAACLAVGAGMVFVVQAALRSDRTPRPTSMPARAGR
jgi:cyanate permease